MVMTSTVLAARVSYCYGQTGPNWLRRSGERFSRTGRVPQRDAPVRMMLVKWNKDFYSGVTVP
jgi:hypothetical protein